MKEKENETTGKDFSNKDIPLSESVQILGQGGEISNELKPKIQQNPPPQTQNLISITLIQNKNNSQNDLNIFDIDDDFLGHESCTSVKLGVIPIYKNVIYVLSVITKHIIYVNIVIRNVTRSVEH